MNEVIIHKTAQLKKLKKPVFILGFPGTGLVGSVAASHLVDVLDLDFGGYLSSSEFAPLAAIHDYVPMPAARIHFSKKRNIVVVISEMTIPTKSSSDVADGIFELAKGMKASAIISLGGISLKEGKEEVYIVSSDRNMIKKAVKKRLAKPIKEGATTGVTGLLLTEGTLKKLPVTTLLASSSADYIDPQAASKVLDVLSKILNIPINTAELEKEAKEVSKGVKEGVIKSKLRRKGPAVSESGRMYG